MRRLTFLLVPLLLLACDREPTALDGQATPAFSATRSTIDLTVGPMVMIAMPDLAFPDSRWRVRDVQLRGPASGSLSGTASATLHANLDGAGFGPAWGTVGIVTTGGDVWQGTLNGTFQGTYPPYPPPARQLFGQLLLHGPDNQTLRAECAETTPASETLVCTGEILRPHG